MSAALASLQGLRILVVEDDYLIAQSLLEALEDAGAEVIGPIGSVDEALERVERDTRGFNAAVLDINLHGRRSYPIADALISRSVPFLFATGYAADVVEQRYARHPRCEKPFRMSEIIAVLKRLAR